MTRDALPSSGTIHLSQLTATLKRTPHVLTALLEGLPDELHYATEGPGTWSPYQIVGHLIYGEDTDWIPRLEIIIEHGESQPFAPFDRTGFLKDYSTQPIDELLTLFSVLRKRNLAILESLSLTPEDLARTGTHPAFGKVTVAQLLSAWAVHDLGHIRQIVRVMAKQYCEAVGPWREYLTIIDEAKR